METVRRFSGWVSRTRYPAVLVGLGLLLALPSLWVGIVADDFTIRAAVLRSELVEGMPGNPWEPFTFLYGKREHNRKLMDRGLLPWWTDPECRAAFMRPLTAVTHMLDYRIWPNYPVLMHLQSLVWFGLLIWAAATLYRRLMSQELPGWTAALAGLLFTLDDAHAFPVGWLANRNVLLAGLFGILTLIAFDRWRRDGWRPGAWLAPLALLAGLLSKETVVCTGAYLLAYALFLDRGRPAKRLFSLLPCLIVGVVWYAFYKTLGFGITSSDVYADPACDPTAFARHVFRHGPILLLGQWGLPGSDVSTVWSTTALNVHWLWAVIFLVLVGVLLVPLVAGKVLARFWALGMVLSVLPACIPFPMDRLLMFVGLGAMGLLAEWLGGLKEGASWLPESRGWKWLARIFAWLFVAIHLVISPLLFVVVVSAPRYIGIEVKRLLATFPNQPELEDQTAIVVNAVWGADRALIQTRHYDGQPLPARILCLSSASSPVSVKRIDARTLAVRPLGGYLPPRGWSAPGCPSVGHVPCPTDGRPPVISVVYLVQLLDRLFRSQDNPLQLHETVELTAATIEITELTEDGRPAEATFRFHVRLDDPSLRWLQLTKKGYAPFQLPEKDGETVEVPTPLSDPGAP